MTKEAKTGEDGEARRRRDEACRLHGEGHVASAVSAYGDVLRRCPADHEIWSNLGVGLRALGKQEAAVACYRRALEFSDGDASYWGNLGNALNDLGRVEDSLAAHRRALDLDPESLLLRHNLALALADAGRFEAALEELDRCLEREPEHPTVNWDRASVLLHLDRYAEGWAAYEWRWRAGQIAPSPYDTPVWRGEALRGDGLLIYADQGFGDTLLASRFLPAVAARGAAITLACHPRLHRLFRGIDGLERLVPVGELVAGAGRHCALLSLPGLLQTTPETLPPSPRLAIPAECRQRAAALLAPAGDRLKVGIVWSGSAGYAHDRRRSVALRRFLPLASVPGVQLFSLHKAVPGEDSVDAQLDSIGAGALIVDLCGDDRDFADAAAAIAALDLVITIDSAVAHLAGTLGRPVWNLLSHSPFWIYGNRGETTPWYPSMRLFRQPRPGDWDSVFDAVELELGATAARSL